MADPAADAEVRADKKKYRETIFEKYAELSGIKKESWETAYKRFARVLQSMSDEIASGNYTVDHVIKSMEEWKATGLSWTLETAHKNIAYPLEKIKSYGGGSGKRSGTTGYSDTQDRSYLEGL